MVKSHILRGWSKGRRFYIFDPKSKTGDISKSHIFGVGRGGGVFDHVSKTGEISKSHIKGWGK